MIVQSYESLFLTLSADVTISVLCEEVLKQADKKNWEYFLFSFWSFYRWKLLSNV